MNKQDNFLDYYIVIEQEAENKEFKIVDHKDLNGCNFLRFYSCLQTFGKRNQNRRLWLSEHMKQMILTSGINNAMQRGRFVGENGHPVPISGEVTMDRILTIDPNNTSHRITELKWESDNKLCGFIETLDEGPGTPGYRFMKNILQGIDPSFSLRSIVPQRKNSDGSIDVMGPGRLVCYDRVYNPSHEEANIDNSIPIKNIITKPKFELVMENFTNYVMDRSEKINRIIDNMSPVMESLSLDKNGTVGVNTCDGRIFISPELKFRNEMKSLIKKL